MNAFSRFFWRLVAAITLFVATVAVFVYSGVYDIGATTPHAKIVEFTLQLATRRAVRTHALGYASPIGMNLRDPALAERAVNGYEAMCRACHGAPGEKPEAWMRGLYPPAPDLTAAGRAARWADREVFWIIKHGIKDTGMAAYGPTHSDDELWALTALVRQLPTMSPDQYRAMKERAAEKAPHAHDEPEAEPHRH